GRRNVRAGSGALAPLSLTAGLAAAPAPLACRARGIHNERCRPAGIDASTAARVGLPPERARQHRPAPPRPVNTDSPTPTVRDSSESGRRLVARLMRHRRAFALGFICTVASTVIALASPWVLKLAIDDLAADVTIEKVRLYAA